jgi:hypothetical protein
LLGSNGSGEGMKPEFFKQNCLELRKRKADFQIINSWIELTIPDLEKTIAKKQKYLRSTIEVLIAVAVCFGLNLVANLISQ